MPICSICQKEAECRMYKTEGCYGVLDVQTCQACHEKAMQEIRRESKFLHIRLKTVKWDKLTTQGRYSQVH